MTLSSRWGSLLSHKVIWAVVGGWAAVIYISQLQFPQTDRNSHGSSGYINFDRDAGLFLETLKKPNLGIVFIFIKKQYLHFVY